MQAPTCESEIEEASGRMEKDNIQTPTYMQDLEGEGEGKDACMHTYANMRRRRQNGTLQMCLFTRYSQHRSIASCACSMLVYLRAPFIN